MTYKRFFILPAIVFLMYFSWISPLICPYWNAFDAQVFTYLNSWVHSSSFWQNFWAFAGHQMMDWIHDVCMLLFFLFNIKFAPRHLKLQKVAELIFSIFFIGAIISIVNGVIFPEWIQIHRDSPTLIDANAFRLGSVVDWIHVKDHSTKSFPGDHATTAILFALLIFHFMGKKMGLLASLYAIFFCLPRLVAGAHWLTDILIGSGLIATITISLAFGTPFANRMIRVIERGLKKLKRRQT